MAIGWAYHPDFLKHITGMSHPERPERLEVIVSALESSGLLARMQPLTFEPVGMDLLSSIHDPAYIDMVKVACQHGVPSLGSSETRVCRDSYGIALLAAGAVVGACDAVMAGKVQRAFCAVRPPGHHAEPDLAMGFCIFNNVAIGAERLISRHGLDRVAIVDFDVHHGNGTQHIFESRDDVLYISLHEHPEYLFPGTGFETEIGHGRGEGFNLNITMPPRADDAAYRRAFSERVLPKLAEYRPEFLLVSAGFDATRADTMADISLSEDSYLWMTRDLVKAAVEHCGGRLVSVLEGGYEAASLQRAIVAHITGLFDEEQMLAPL